MLQITSDFAQKKKKKKRKDSSETKGNEPELNIFCEMIMKESVVQAFRI